MRDRTRLWVLCDEVMRFMKQSPIIHSKKALRSLLSTTAILALAAVSHADVKYAPVANSQRFDLAGYFLPAATNKSEHVTVAVSLQLRDAAGLEKFAQQVSDPSSPLYRQFLTPEQVGAKFGASRADVEAVVAFLKAAGISVTINPKNNMTVVAEGTVAQMESAFKTSIVHVNLGEGDIRTNTTPLYMPAAIAGKVISIDGIDSSLKMQRRATTTVLTPTTFYGCYNVGPSRSAGYYGTGRNIGFANWDGLKVNNLPYWYSAYSLPTPSGGVGTNVHIVAVASGTLYNTQTPQGEGDLDLQMMAMAAPLANIYIYDDSTSDASAPITTYTKIVNDNILDVVSESYGWLTTSYKKTTKTYTRYASTYVSAHNLHLSMTAQGITYCAASGDAGTAGFNDTTTANYSRYAYPAIEPEVLSVGGTVATVDSTTGARSSEKSWGYASSYGGGGGFDPYDTVALGFTMNAAPTYQTSYLASKVATYPYRLFPDVSLHAAGSDGLTTYGWKIYYNQANATYPVGTQVTISGTSASSPAVAGLIGLLGQRVFSGVTANSSRSNVRFGRFADYLYKKGGNTSVYTDITTGTSIGTLPGTTTAATPAAGWDFATGWGVPNFDGLYHSFLTGKKP